MKKDDLVEVVAKHLRKLRKDDLVSLGQRLEAKTLDLADLALPSDGHFGFQEELKGEGGSGGSRGQDGDGREEGLLERGGDVGRGLLQKAKGVVGG